MNVLIKDFRRIMAAPLIIAAALTTACAPIGYGDVGFTYVNWPVQDQQLPPSNLTEVESHLIRLGYLSGTPDGAITPATRSAIKHFQSDIGAPPNGFISPTLLTALRINAGLGEEIIVGTPVGARAIAPAPSGRNDDGGGGGRGGGGSGGWQ